MEQFLKYYLFHAESARKNIYLKKTPDLPRPPPLEIEWWPPYCIYCLYFVRGPSKHKIYLYNIYTMTGRRCINVIQMVCVCWGSDFLRVSLCKM